MFNTYKFSTQELVSYSICFIFLLITFQFFKTIFTISNNVMPQRSFLNISFFIFQTSFYLWHISILIYLSGDIEINPGPVTNYSQGFKICHWNLNSLPAANFIKILLLESDAIFHNIDIIVCLKLF